MKPVAVDLFSGCGGLSQGLIQAGFDVKVAVEIDKDTVDTYKLNHENTHVINTDICDISPKDILDIVGTSKVELIAGCPPCQGFSKLGGFKNAELDDERNRLVSEFFRIVKGIQPNYIMMENVPGLKNYKLFQEEVEFLTSVGYYIDYKVVNIADFGVPQRRKRLVLIGSKLAPITIPEKVSSQHTTVRDFIYDLPPVNKSDDPFHKIHSQHSEKIKDIISMIPKDGGNRKDLPEEFWLDCHKKRNVGYSDVYGRLSWDKVSSTITGGCMNPSKGRFLHPEENRSLTAREAALLQTFPKEYKFSITNKVRLAQMIGNAFPPVFSEMQGRHIISHYEAVNHLN